MTREEIENLKPGDRVKSISDGNVYELDYKYLNRTFDWVCVVISNIEFKVGEQVIIHFTSSSNTNSYFELLPKEKTKMKIECKKIDKKEVTYPCFKKCLGASPEMIVLFFNETSGVVVSGKTLGTYSSHRDPKNYSEPLKNYSVTFSTEE